jgi:enoyl-CoA hydratase/carnithine racemase
MFARWADVTTMSKPIIAAVNGFALGGGTSVCVDCFRAILCIAVLTREMSFVLHGHIIV